MKVNRKKLLEVLALVKPGLAAKEKIEQSGSFVFTDGRVFTYNDEIAVSHPTDFHIEGAVSAAEFFQLLNKSKDDELDIDTDNEGMTVQGKNFKATILLQAEIVLPIRELGVPDKMELLPKDFSDAIKFCLFSAGKDMTQPVLTCLHVTKDVVESCDRFRITRRYFDKEYFPEAILIPAAAAKELANYEAVEYAVGNGWLHFATEQDTLFSCRTYERLQFPNLDKFVQVQGSSLKFPADMKEILDRASIFSSTVAKDAHIKIALADGKIIVSGVGEGGKFEEWCRVRYNGEQCHFHLTPQFLSSVLDLQNEAIVSEDALMFEGETFTHVVSLLSGK